jgi:ABC-type sugar transport system ATPase subunit
VHAITGENGAGKSTLMRIVAGLDSPDTGAVRFHGRAIAMIHQELQTFPDLSVAENIWMGQERMRAFGILDKPAMFRDSRELLARVGVAIDPRTTMRRLSIAEQQSVEIAKALGRDADLIIMDEPTSALSAHESAALFQIIRDLKSRGVTILYISHRMEEIFDLADTITVLRDGLSVASEPAHALDQDRLVALMVGRAVEARTDRARHETGPIALEVRGLAREGRFRDVSFALRRGEILGLAGLMGAGRSDVAAAIYGLAPATEGEIRIDGVPARIASPADALARGIAMVTEDRREFGVIPEMSVKENITLTSLRAMLIDHREERAIADRQISDFRVRTSGREQPLKELSGGNQQKVVLARALLTKPEIVILDEPTRGIDIGAKLEIHALIRTLASEGKAILLVSSEMNELLLLADRILVMKAGAIVAEVAAEGISAEDILRYAVG